MEIVLDDVLKRKVGGRKSKMSATQDAKEDKKAEHTAQELADMLHHHVQMHGSGFFSDFWDGFKKGFKGVMSVAKPILGVIPHPAAQGASGVLGALGLGKTGGAVVEPKEEDGGAVTGGGKVTAGSKKKGTGGVTGGGKVTAGSKKKGKGGVTGGSSDIIPSSDRKALIKEVMEKYKMTMINASKYVKEHNLYIKKSK